MCSFCLQLVKEVISTKAIKYNDQSSKSMVKSCYMTIFCAAIVIFILIIIVNAVGVEF